MHKLSNLLGEDLRLIQLNKGARVGEKLQSRVRKGLLETNGKARGEERIIFSPHKQHRMVEAGETPSSFQGVAVGDSPEEARHMASHPRQMKQGMDGSGAFRR